MIKIFLLCMTLISSISPRCLEGCLRCTPDNKCLYCDVLNGFQLRSERCIRPQIPNCVVTNDKSQCLICQNDFYLDLTLNQCFELIPQTKVENCLTHEAPKVCSVCVKNFYLKKGACVKIDAPIANCKIETSQQICQECEIGFIRSINKKTCIPKPTISGCSTYQHVTCRECNSNYLLNENYYFDLLYKFKTQKDIENLATMAYAIKNNSADSTKFPVCQLQEISNCSVFQSFNRCKKCINGYFVNSRFLCEENPKETIQNCLRYSSLTTCLSCAQGYQLKESQCVSVFAIDNCLLFKTDSTTSICTRCYDDYYLSAENLCTKRTDLSQIDLCEKLALNFEKCAQCLQGYVPTQDGFRCLAVIDNCQSYDFSNKNTIQLTCAQCSNGFYYNINDRVCIKGTVEYCLTYTKNDDNCAVCQNKFYLVENRCEQQKQMPFCSVYHPTNKNTCQQCDENSFLFSRLQSCEPVTRIPRCEIYSNKTSCKKCRDGYFLASPSECVQISPKENCLQKVGTDCTKCLPHFALFFGQCLRAYDWVKSGCQSNNLTGLTNLNDLKCDSCKENFVPIDVNQTFMCHEQKLLHRIMNQNKARGFDQDCLQYSISEDNYQCVKCVPNRVLADGECKENCYVDGKQTLYRQWVSLYNVQGESTNDSFKIDYVNICEKTIPNCAVASLDVSQDFINIKYSCEKCVDGFVPIINIPEFGQVVKNLNQDKDLTLHMPQTSGPGMICVDIQGNKTLGNVNPRGQIDFCEYYINVEQNVFGCRKCMQGKTGKVIQIIKNCRVFNNFNSCTECEQLFYLANPTECRPIVKIDMCSKYNTTSSTVICTECLPTHFLNAGVCVSRVISMNRKNCTLSVTLDDCVCSTGFVKHPNTKDCLKVPDFCEGATVVNDVINCAACDQSKAYLEANQCKVGTVGFCAKFQPTLNKCAECQNGYYFENEQCKANTANLDTLCSKWNITQKDVCVQCKNEATKFERFNKCQAVTVIDNCISYQDIFSCKTCAKGYYLNNVSKRCLAIPAEMNCEVMRVIELNGLNVFDKNDYTENLRYLFSCDQCKVNFYRRQYSVLETYFVQPSQNTQNITIFQCVDWLKYHTQNCSINNTAINGLENFGKFCSGCEQDFLPIEMTGKYVCLNRKYLTVKNNSFVNDPNCKAYEYTAARAMQCRYCNPGFFLDNNVCQQACVTGGTQPFVFFVDANMKVQRHVCATAAAITNCQYYTSSVSFDTATTLWTQSVSCYKCDSSSVPVFDPLATTIKISTLINAIDQDLDVIYNNQEFPALKCTAYGVVPIIGLATSNKIPNCAVYVFDGTTDYGCIRCKQRYRGRVVKGANKGYLEFCEEMTDCDTKIQGGLSVNATFKALHNNPIGLFSCQKCTDSTKIPAIFVDATGSTLFEPTSGKVSFDYFRTDKLKDNTANNTLNVIATVAITKVTQPGNSYHIQCVDQTKIETTLTTETTFLTHAAATTFASNVNCALITVDVKALTGAAKCIACKEGFIPTIDVTGFVTACTTDTLCQSNGTQLNRCGNCVYKYNIVDQQVDNQLCLANKGTSKCFAGEGPAATFNCRICDVGYELTATFKCVLIEAPSCKSFKSNITDYFNSTYLVSQSRIFQYVKHNYDYYIPGCTECSSPDDVLYLVNNTNDTDINPTICSKVFDTANVFSTALSNEFKNLNTALANLTNCKRYGYKDKNFVCVECDTAFFQTLEDSKCNAKQTVDTDNLPYCLIAETLNGTMCKVCETNYTNIGGLCRKTTPVNGDADFATVSVYIDTNCQTFADASKTTYQSICAKCKSNFYARVTVTPFNKCTAIPATEPNCQDYLDETGCVQCKAGYGLMLISQKYSDFKPLRTCSKMDNNVASSFDHDSLCKEVNVISDTGSLNQQRLSCRECKANSVLVVDNLSYSQKCYSIVPPIPNCIEYNSPDVLADIKASQLQNIKLKDFTCQACSDIKLFYLNQVEDTCVSRTSIVECKTYDKYADRCIECNLGSYLSQDRLLCLSFKTNTTHGYFDTCRDIEKCNMRTWFEGLNAQMSSIYSCHGCLKPDEIPFAVGSLELDVKFPGFERFAQSKQFGSDFIPFRGVNDVVESSMIQCLKPVQESFGMNSNFAFPANCGLGFVNLNSLLKQNNLNQWTSHDASHSTGNVAFDYQKATIRCAVCKPGFKPSRQNYMMEQTQPLGFLVTACTAITNCEASTWFNGCSQCKPGFAHSYTSEGAQFDTCITVPEVHKGCWAYDESTARCVFCKKGTYLNRDAVCELINSPNCKPREFRFNEFYNGKNIQQGLYWSSSIVGCSQCEEGFVGVFINKPKSVCVQSLYHVNNSQIDNTFFTKNCQEYGWDVLNQLQCRTCKDTFVKSRKTNKCFPETTLANCLEATSESLCDVCKKGFVLVNRACETSKIQNCLVFGNDLPNIGCEFCGKNQQICIQCEKEFYLEGNQCLKGTITNCKVQETSNICRECDSNFTLLLSKSGKSYCYPNDPKLNCKTFVPQLLQAQILSCESCVDPTFVLSLSETDRPIQSCMRFLFTDRCVKYQNNPIAIGDSSFKCIQCELNSFLENGLCVFRKVLPDVCTKFDPLSDSCLECQIGYFRSTDGKQCVAYPQGIDGCEVYLNRNTCLQCQPANYLKDRLCLPIKNVIVNCLYYEDEGVCSKCTDAFVSLKGQCFQSLATGCATFENINACRTCAPGFVLMENSSGVINCIQNLIPNCIIVDNVDPYNCLKCAGNFFPNLKECVAVTTLIVDCLFYSTATTCTKCAPLTALSTDGTSCQKSPELINHVDLNCVDNLLTKDPTCNTCLPGQLFLYGKCISCPDNMIQRGCFTCDPFNRQRCLMCSSGWIQTPEGDCVKPITESVGLDDIGRSLREVDLDDTFMRRLQ